MMQFLIFINENWNIILKKIHLIQERYIALRDFKNAKYLYNKIKENIQLE